jgi:hypothetical protein
MTASSIRPVELRDGYFVPHITAWSSERVPPQPLTVRPIPGGGEGLGFPDEVSHIDRQHGALWVRVPAARRGEPEYQNVHALRQRQAMRRLLCQVCGGPAQVRPDGRVLFLVASAGGTPITEGERTEAPPVHAVCARLAVEHCPPLRRQGWAAALVAGAPVWGVAGVIYHPLSLQPMNDGKSHDVPLTDQQLLRWTLATRLVVALEGVTPVTDLDALADHETAVIPASR